MGKPKPTSVPHNEAALVTIDNMTGLSLLIPGEEAIGTEERVPDLVIYLTACFIKFHKDKDFVDRLVQEYIKHAEENDDTVREDGGTIQ